MPQTSIRDIFSNPEVGTKHTVCAWVRTRRDSKGVSFLTLNDGTSFQNLQVVADTTLPDFENTVLNANTGASVQVTGQLQQSQGKDQAVELLAESVLIVGECSVENYPLQKKRHTNEFLRTIAHLRPRTNTFSAVFRVRSVASFAIHKFFNDNGFVYLHSPIISTSDCEGAGHLFNVTTLPLESVPKTEEGAVNFGEDFFGQKASLTVSGQLEGETFASAFSKIYTFGPTFRAENSNTPRHLAEFWMIEPEMCFCDLAGNMQLAEQFTKYVLGYVLENCPNEMEFFDKWVEPGILQSLQHVLSSSFETITYTEAIAALEKSGKTFEFKPSWGADLQTEHERFLTEEHVGRPVFVTNYPKEIKAFYMRLDSDGRTVSAMDLLVPRIGEIIGGSQREERADVLLQKIRAAGLPEEHYWWYLDLRRFGTTPHAGFGLGLERLIMYLTGMKNIRDVIPFPRTPGNAEF